MIKMQASNNDLARRTMRWLLLSAIAISSGCANAKQGALSGTGIGALSGLAIGSLTGSAGKGAAIGAITGGVGGAIIGDQNRRKSEEAARQQPPPPPPPAVVVVTPQQPYATGSVLGRLVGQWNINGTIDSGGGAPLPVVGTARGTIDKTYFLRLDISFNDPRTGQPVQGTSVISQTGGYGLAMSNAFSSSPAVKQFKGEMDMNGTVFVLSQTDPPMRARKIVIQIMPSGQWTAEVSENGRQLESYTFTWRGPNP